MAVSTSFTGVTVAKSERSVLNTGASRSSSVKTLCRCGSRLGPLSYPFRGKVSQHLPGIILAPTSTNTATTKISTATLRCSTQPLNPVASETSFPTTDTTTNQGRTGALKKRSLCEQDLDRLSPGMGVRLLPGEEHPRKESRHWSDGLVLSRLLDQFYDTRATPRILSNSSGGEHKTT